MKLQLLALSALISCNAYAMHNGSSLSHNQLLTVTRTTIVAQAVAKTMYEQLGLAAPADATPAKIAEQTASIVIEQAKRGETLTNKSVQETITKSLAEYFAATNIRKIRTAVEEETKKLRDGLVPL